MMKYLATVSLCALMLVVVGCNSGNPQAQAEVVMKDMLASMNEMADAFEKSKDAKDAKPKVDALGKKFEELKKKADAIKLPKDQEKVLETKYAPQIQEAMQRVMKASFSLAMKDPNGMKDLGESMKSFGK